MRAALRWVVYLVIMLAVGFVGLIISSMMMGGTEMATETAPAMAEKAPPKSAPPPAPSPPPKSESKTATKTETDWGELLGDFKGVGKGGGGTGIGIRGTGQGGAGSGFRQPNIADIGRNAGDGRSYGEGTKTAPVDPFAAADKALEGLRQANIAFNTPDELTVGKSEMVQLLLSMQKTVEELKTAVSAKGARDGATIEVSNKMEAKLTGSGFDIRAVTPEVQVISPTAQTEWKWEVEPTSTDAKRLHLTLSAHVMLDGEKIPRVVKTFERTMNVKVNWTSEAYSFATGNWEWLWATLLVPVAGEVMRRRKKGKAAASGAKDA